MKIWECDEQWPLCLYDFSFKNKNPTYTCLRVQQPLYEYCIADYFYGAKFSEQTTPLAFCDHAKLTQAELLVERQHHLCATGAGNQHPHFQSNFKTRYQARDICLLQNPFLTAFLEDDLHLNSLAHEFKQCVAAPLNNEIIEQASADRELTH